MATQFCDVFFFIYFVYWLNVCFATTSRCVSLMDNVSCEDSDLEAVPRDILRSAKVLYLNKNNIKEITAESFSGLYLLEEIDLSNNVIEKIDPSAFAQLPNLTTLNLSGNKLEHFPVLHQNSSLLRLELSHNLISSLDMTSLARATRLQHLDVRFNELEGLTTPFPCLPHLTELHLSNNRISSLGNNATFAHLPALETLRLAKNQISELHKNNLAPLVNLQQLDLSKNRLTELDGLTFRQMSRLTSLKLRRNNLTLLQDGCFYGLGNIAELELDDNNLSLVNKSWLYGLASLKTLTLSFNRIEKIVADAWEYSPSLQYLDLSQNSLTHIDEASFSRLSRLQTLLFQNNSIAHIGAATFAYMSALRTLDLSHNEVSWSLEAASTLTSAVGVFEGLSTLESLRLDNNGLQSLREGVFRGLGALRSLYLEENNVSTVHEKAFTPLTALRELHMRTSSLLCDCKLAWLGPWLADKQLGSTVQGVCAYPDSVVGRALSELSAAEFICDRDTDGTFRPLMVKEPETGAGLKALKGQALTLHCSAASRLDSPLTVHWRKDHFPVPTQLLNTTGSVMDGVVVLASRLYIPAIRDEDAGDYQCMAVNAVGKTYSGIASVTVHVFPTFTKRPVDVVVKAAAVARLECAAAGQPDPEISWQKDGGEDFPAARERRMQVMANDVFMISHVKPEDRGVYTCTAQNAAGTIMSNATLTVLEAPTFVVPMQDSRVKVGDTAVIECKATGIPQPSITWSKDGGALKLTERHFFTAEDQLLVIMEAKVSDAGEYTCFMQNQLGAKADTVYLTIEDIAGDASTTWGVIAIAVVCGVVLTSLIWVVLIYLYKRRRAGTAAGSGAKSGEEYSGGAATDETMVATHELQYSAVHHHAGGGGSGGAFLAANKLNGFANGHVNGRTRHIVLEDGLHVTYDNGLHITHNPLDASNGLLLAYTSTDELKQTAPQSVYKCSATVEHHRSSLSSISAEEGGQSEETSNGRVTTSSTSPGTQSTQSTSYPHVVISPTSPHNSSLQPLLAEERGYGLITSTSLCGSRLPPRGAPHTNSSGGFYQFPDHQSQQENLQLGLSLLQAEEVLPDSRPALTHSQSDYQQYPANSRNVLRKAPPPLPETGSHVGHAPNSGTSQQYSSPQGGMLQSSQSGSSYATFPRPHAHTSPPSVSSCSVGDPRHSSSLAEDPATKACQQRQPTPGSSSSSGERSSSPEFNQYSDSTQRVQQSHSNKPCQSTASNRQCPLTSSTEHLLTDSTLSSASNSPVHSLSSQPIGVGGLSKSDNQQSTERSSVDLSSPDSQSRSSSGSSHDSGVTQLTALSRENSSSSSSMHSAEHLKPETLNTEENGGPASLISNTAKTPRKANNYVNVTVASNAGK